MKKKKINPFLVLLIILAIGVIIALLPPVRERLAYRIDRLMTQIFYALNPPEQAVFVPKTPTPGSSLQPSATFTPQPTLTETPVTQVSLTPTLTTTPLPPSIALSGVRYMDQHGVFNYCAPANLAMELSYWGWPGTREDIGPVVKPFAEDFNVMVYELADYVTENTDFEAIYRSGGTLELLKTLLAGGFPVLIEKGAYMQDLSGRVTWMGHYNIITGYDDTKAEIIVQDSYYTPDYPIAYDELIKEWRSFNYIFLVVYPPDQQEHLFALLGDYTDEQKSNQIAYDKASAEIYNLEGADQFFAWFNRGSSMAALQDYMGAAESYDQAFGLYAGLPENDRPFRMMWYQTGPYNAYFNAGRYQDVIDLATTTLDAARSPYLEESFIWRARAYYALGQTGNAQSDLCTALPLHPGFAPILSSLQAMGLTEADCP